MKKNTAKKRGWVPYVVAGLALSFVLSLLFPPDEEAPEAPPAPTTTISGNSSGAATLIPHETLNLEANRVLDKLTLEIEVPLVDERLPSKQELSAIAKHLVGTPRHARTFVFFYLPGMEVDAGAYATAHYLPQPEGVKLVPLGLYRTDYEYLDPDSMEIRRAAPSMAPSIDAEDFEMKFVRDTWICPTSGPIETEQVFPLLKTLCNKVEAGTVWIAMDSRPDYNAPEAVSPGVISVTHPWGTGNGPWFMPSGSLSLSPL